MGISLEQIDQESSADIATADQTTESTSDVLVTGATRTPTEGNRMVWFTGSVQMDNAGATVFMSIYVGGSIVQSSEVELGAHSVNEGMGFACSARVMVDGSETIEGRWRVSANNATLNEGVLMLLQVDNG